MPHDSSILHKPAAARRGARAAVLITAAAIAIAVTLSRVPRRVYPRLTRPPTVPPPVRGDGADDARQQPQPTSATPGRITKADGAPPQANRPMPQREAMDADDQRDPSQAGRPTPDLATDDAVTPPATLLALLDAASLNESVRLARYDDAPGAAAAAAASLAAAFARNHPSSLVAHYEARAASCAARPARPLLAEALDAFRPQRPHGAETAARLRAGELLVFHDVRADTQSLCDALRVVATNGSFSGVVALAHGGGAAASQGEADGGLAAAAARLGVPLQTVASRGAEADLKLVRSAAHVLLHGGALCALAALAAPGVAYITETMHEFAGNDEFRWLVSDLRAASRSEDRLAPLFARDHRTAGRFFGLFGRVRPTCCAFRGYGVGDQEKVLCENIESVREKGCWVMSVGCGNKFLFETDVVRRTPCDVHVFDCTRDHFSVPAELRERVTWHKLCLGAVGDRRGDYRSWRELLAVGSRAMNEGELRMPAITKMDIEGSEFAVFNVLVDEDAAVLPKQMVVEIHTASKFEVGPPFVSFPNKRGSQANATQVQALVQRLFAKGYTLIRRADNPFCMGCSEINLALADALPPGL